jgi:cell wall-associated NlpC family hydrolase
MNRSTQVQPRFAPAIALLLLSGCAQGTLAVSPSTILNSVILAGSVIGAHGSTSSGSTSSSASRARNIPNSPRATATASRVLGTADQYVGVKYTWGGNTPQSGFDCSGFTKWVFGKQGIQLPRTSREQARAGQGVPLDFGAMLPGDIILFAEPGEAISHVAIYVGSGEIIHSSSGYHGVTYTDLNTHAGDWYVQNMVVVRRLTSNGRSLVQSLSFLTIPGLPFDPPDRAPVPR